MIRWEIILATIHHNPSSAIKNEPKLAKHIRCAHRRKFKRSAFQNNNCVGCRTMSEMCFVSVRCAQNKSHNQFIFRRRNNAVWRDINMEHTYLLWQLQNEHLSKTNNNGNARTLFYCLMFECGYEEKSGPKPTARHSENSKNEEHTRWIKYTRECVCAREWYKHYCAHTIFIIWHTFRPHTI